MVGSHDDGYAANKTRMLELEGRAIRIQVFNDLFRQGKIDGMLVVTKGIHALGRARMEKVLSMVRTFSDFTGGNDPYQEHDFGSIDLDDIRVFWKIDAYDKALEHGSPDRSSPDLTTLVLTVMLAEEY